MARWLALIALLFSIGSWQFAQPHAHNGHSQMRAFDDPQVPH